MPLFTVYEVKLELSRLAVMLDTNVVYAAFSAGDFRHDDSVTFLQLGNQYVLPLPVIIETWGLLVGRDANWRAGFEFLEWLQDPKSGVVVINHTESFDKIKALASSIHIDCVDA